MTLLDWLVVLGGAMLIALVIWWFFIAGDPGAVRHDHHSH